MMPPEERAILDWLQFELDRTYSAARTAHVDNPWRQRGVQLLLTRRVARFMEEATLAAAGGHRTEAFHREFVALAELAWGIPDIALDPIEWDAELSAMTGGAA